MRGRSRTRSPRRRDDQSPEGDGIGARYVVREKLDTVGGEVEPHASGAGSAFDALAARRAQKGPLGDVGDAVACRDDEIFGDEARSAQRSPAPGTVARRSSTASSMPVGELRPRRLPRAGERFRTVARRRRRDRAADATENAEGRASSRSLRNMGTSSTAVQPELVVFVVDEHVLRSVAEPVTSSKQ